MTRVWFLGEKEVGEMRVLYIGKWVDRHEKDLYPLHLFY